MPQTSPRGTDHSLTHSRVRIESPRIHPWRARKGKAKCRRGDAAPSRTPVRGEKANLGLIWGLGAFRLNFPPCI